LIFAAFQAALPVEIRLPEVLSLGEPVIDTAAYGTSNLI
jgi:hypothetical protein